MARPVEGCCLDHDHDDPRGSDCITAEEMREEMRLRRWEEERDDHR